MIKQLNSSNTFCILIHSPDDVLVIPIQDRWRFNSVMCGMTLKDVIWFHHPTDEELFEVTVALASGAKRNAYVAERLRR